MYQLDLVDEHDAQSGPGVYPPAPLLRGYAAFCCKRFRGQGSTTTVAIAPESGAAPIGWLTGVTFGGRFDALPDRMYGLVRADKDVCIDLDELFQRLRREFGGKFTVNFPPEILSGPYEASHRANAMRYHAYDTFVLQAADHDEAWQRLDRVGRQGVSKAEKDGVTVSRSTDGGAWMCYLGLHVAKNSRKGSPVLNRVDIRTLNELFGQRLGLVTAHLGTKPIASVLYVVQGEYAMLIDNASLPEHWQHNPNNLAVWEAIRDCIDRGARTVDFGFSSIDDDGTARFKMHMGGERHPVFAAMSS